MRIIKSTTPGLSAAPAMRRKRRIRRIANGGFKVFARVDNLFNLHYQNPTGSLAPGLGVFGGVRFASVDVK
jgi:hypothetical protein